MLFADAVLCAAAGLAALLFAGSVADLFDIPPGVVRLVGAILVVWALALVGLTRHPARPRVLGGVAIVNTVAAGTLLGLAPSAPDRAGQTVLAIAGVVVALFAVAQGWARRATPAPRA